MLVGFAPQIHPSSCTTEARSSFQSQRYGTAWSLQDLHFIPCQPDVSHCLHEHHYTQQHKVIQEVMLAVGGLLWLRRLPTECNQYKSLVETMGQWQQFSDNWAYNALRTTGAISRSSELNNHNILNVSLTLWLIAAPQVTIVEHIMGKWCHKPGWYKIPRHLRIPASTDRAGWQEHKPKYQPY